VTRPRRAAAHTRRAARPPRRRWAGLAAAALVGALVTGGVAAAATGNLPGPVQNVARNILGDGGGGPVAPTEPGQQPAAAGPSHTSTATPTGPTDGSQGGQPAGTGGPGPGPRAAGNPAGPDTVRLCRAFLAGKGAEQGKNLDATVFQALAKLAGGAEKIPSYCEEVLAGGAKPKEQDKKPQPPPGGGQGQGGPPTSTGGAGDQGQNDQRTTRS
jgi:hypothetical protein